MRVLEPISDLPYLSRLTTVETRQETFRTVIELKSEGLKLTCGAGCPVGRDVGDRHTRHGRSTEGGRIGDVGAWRKPQHRRMVEIAVLGAARDRRSGCGPRHGSK